MVDKQHGNEEMIERKIVSVKAGNGKAPTEQQMRESRGCIREWGRVASWHGVFFFYGG